MASARPRPPRRLLRQVKQATPAIHSTRPLCHGSSHDPSGRRLSPRYRNRTDGATRAITSTRTCGNTNAGLDQPRPTVALLAKLETQRVVGSPAAVVAQLGVALRREPGCDAGAVEAAAEALADRLTRAGSKHRGAAAPVTEQVPARALRALRVGGRRLDWRRCRLAWFPPAATSTVHAVLAHGSPTSLRRHWSAPLDPPVPEGARGDDELVEADSQLVARVEFTTVKPTACGGCGGRPRRERGAAARRC